MEQYAQVLEKVDASGNFELSYLPREGFLWKRGAFWRQESREWSPTTDFGHIIQGCGIISDKVLKGRG
jgi:hypothetical protein